MAGEPKLKRTLGLWTITFYGLGTILGAGIYVLIGKVAGLAGSYTPIAFCVAALIAAFSAFSYAELSSRFPKSAGEAVYLSEAFGVRWFSALAGWMVVSVGIVSAATIAKGFAGYLNIFINIQDTVAIMLLVVLLGAIAAWGIRESAFLISVLTLVEVGGLLLVIYVSGEKLAGLPEYYTGLIPPVSGAGAPAIWTGILLGSFIAFYAYIGFEDMVKEAEEVVDARRKMPVAIILALVISTILYIAVSITAVISLSFDELSLSDAPLADIVERAGYSPRIISLISLVAITNGALVQIIMASRTIYGMRAFGGSPAGLAKVNKRTRTPLIATALVAFIVLVMALWLPIIELAKITSFITLLVFALINLALVVVKLRHRESDRGEVSYPLIIPVIGFVLCLAILIFQTVV